MTIGEIVSELRTLSKSDRPIIVGPWLSEVGFELLYWIPFLRWAIETARIPKERLWILSRGGCRSWYSGISPNYLELYDGYTPDQLTALNQRRVREQAAHARSVGLKRGQRTAKQFYSEGIESGIVADSAARAGLSHPIVLRPALMYQAFRPIWRQRKADLFGQWSQMTRAGRMWAPPKIEGAPKSYVAVKFYASEACPDTPDNRETVARIVNTIADRIPVVLLHTGTAYDEHGEFPIPEHPRVYRPRFDPTTNLDQQTALIAGASAFVGTYGGFAYLAPFLGVPTTAFYGLPNFRRDHLRLMTTVASRRLSVDFRAMSLPQGPALMKHAEWSARAA